MKSTFFEYLRNQKINSFGYLKVCFSFFLILFLNFLNAQEVKQAFGIYDFKVYQTEDGLPGLVITSFMKDSKGYLWIGAYGGISRFDGKNFISYTTEEGLPNNRISKIVEDTLGNFWIGTDNGLSRFDGDTFVNYFTEHNLPHNQIWDVHKDIQNRIWVATSGGWCQVNYYPDSDTVIFNNYKISDDPKTNIIKQIVSGKKGEMYIGADDKIYRFENDSVYPLEIKLGVYNMIIDQAGQLWTTRWGSFQCYVPDSSQSILSFKKIADHNFGFPTSYLYEDPEGIIWIGTWNKGLFKYDGKTFTQFTTKNGLPGNSIWSIFMDEERNLWVGTFDAGLVKLSQEKFIQLDQDYGLANDAVNSIFKDSRNNLWIATEAGISVLDTNKQIVNFREIENIHLNKINGFAEDLHGSIYFSSYGGIPFKTGFVYKQQKWIRTESGFGSFCITSDYQGNIWGGHDGGGGAQKFDGVSSLHYQMGSDRNQNRILRIFEDRDHNIWMGTYKFGITIFRNDSLLSFAKEFDHSIVTAITQDSTGNIWVGTEGNGLFNCILKGNQIQVNKRMTKADGIPGGIINGLLVDQFENLWIGSNMRAGKLDLHAFYGKGEINIVNYGMQEGLKGVSCTPTCLDAEGFLWFATPKGAVRYNYRKDIKNRIEPKLLITDIKLFFHKENLGRYADHIDNKSGLPVKMVLPFDKNHLTFEFIGLSYQNPDMVKYQYKLEGFDNEWSPVTKKSEATYSNLPPGNYSFLVKSCNNDGLWNKYPSSIQFAIAAPFWQTWWFYGSSFILLILGIHSFMKVRTNNLRQSKLLLEEKVKVRTIEVVKQKEEIELQKLIVEEKNKAIIDSMQYAKRIQSAILPPEKLIKQYLEKSFILYLPKDIVAGDFYWLEHKDDNILFAAADCTGHGVPGAMVSVVCNNGLNRSVREYGISEPGKILDKTREIIIQEFEKSEEDVKDGMDIALCSLRFEVRGLKLKDSETVALLQYAGANNSLWIIRNKEFIEYKPNKQPIGKVDNPKPFTTHTIELQKEDTVYVFTDGFADQFGGEKGKKFMYKPFKELLLSIQEKTMEEQKIMLEQHFENWKEKLEQVDDVCIIGVRI